MYFTTEIYPDPVNGFLKNNVAVFRSAMTDINLFCTCVSVFLFPLVFLFFFSKCHKCRMFKLIKHFFASVDIYIVHYGGVDIMRYFKGRVHRKMTVL